MLKDVKSLPKDFTIVNRASDRHAVLSNRYGEKYFLKYPRTITKEGLVELLNELIVDKIHKKMGIRSLNIYPEIVDGRLGLVEDHYPYNWSYVAANPNMEVRGKSLFGNLLVAEVLVRQTDRAPGKPEHIGVGLEDGKIVWAPIDNGHSLKGCSREYAGTDEDLNP